MNNNENIPFIPFDDVWNDLRPQLDAEAARRNKRKKRVLWWWFSGAMLVAVAVIWFNFWANNTSQSQSKDAMHSNTIANSQNKDAMHSNTLANSQSKDAMHSNTLANSQSKDAMHSNTLANSQNKDAMHSNTLANSQSKDAMHSNTLANSQNKDSMHSNTLANSQSKDAMHSNTLANSQSKDAMHSNTYNPTNNIIKLYRKTITNAAVTNQQTHPIALVESESVVNEPESKMLNIKNTATPKSATPKPITQHQKLQYGLQWNLPLFSGFNYKDVNAQNQPLTAAIPQLWVGKNMTDKSSWMVFANPYSQYYLHNSPIVGSSNYSIMVHNANDPSKPAQLIYTESTRFNKLILMELGLAYQYLFAKNLKAGLAISGNKAYQALMQNRVLKSYNELTKDSLFGIDKNNAEWTNLNPFFVQTKLQLSYSFNKIDVGLCVSKPITPLFSKNVGGSIPFNANIYVSWRLAK